MNRPARFLPRALLGAIWTLYLLVAGAAPVRADNCADLSDCFSGNLWPALLLLLGLALLIGGAWFLGPLLARFAMGAALRTMVATAGRSRMAAFAARFLSRFASRGMSFVTRNLQHAFKHAKDFGITGPWNSAAGQAFRQAIQNHIKNATTIVVRGTYRGQPVTHFFNPQTGLNVIRNAQGAFQSGWRLSAQQIQHLLRGARLGGG